MSDIAQQILDEMRKFMVGCGGTPDGWFVGIAKDPRKKLFVGHNVSERFDAWMYRQAPSYDDAIVI